VLLILRQEKGGYQTVIANKGRLPPT